MKVVFNQHITDPKVEIFRARRVEIRTYRPLAVQVDGDYIGNTPIVMEVVPRAINLMVPLHAPASLFVDGTGLLAHENAWEWMVRRAKDAHVALRARSGMP